MKKIPANPEIHSTASYFLSCRNSQTMMASASSWFSASSSSSSSPSSCSHHLSTTSTFSSFRRRRRCRLSCRRTSFSSHCKKHHGAALCLASRGLNSDTNVERKRKVVEHIYLLKAKKDLSDVEEKNMLDYLYTTQYHMSGIVAISLGRTSDQTPEEYTHVVCMRFQSKQDLARFYENSSYLQVLKEHVMPHCHESKYVDFESEVIDDILPVFRKGEEFNYGVEFVLLITFHASTIGATAEVALASLEQLATEFPNLIVQLTQGCNFNPGSAEFTHGVVIRFRSTEALELFLDSSEYKDIWNSKFRSIVERTLAIQFVVDPVGTELM